MTNLELANFSVKEEFSRGRLYNENYEDNKYRSIFGRDRDRIINSSAFRRLQYKTQVFVNHEGDHYRTRLTHSLEVAQIARWIAGGLGINKDLAEIVSLAHDIGHPAFGHAGEEALNEKMEKIIDENGKKLNFSHNAHTLKLITKIETRFIDFEGLNLSWEILEAVVKHNGAFIYPKVAEEYIVKYSNIHDLELLLSPSLEGQVSAIADDIAYNNHDLEDGLRAGLFDVEELLELPLIGRIYLNILEKHPKIKREILVGEAKKIITLEMVVNLIESSKKNLSDNKIKNLEEVRLFKDFLINFDNEFQEVQRIIKGFLMKKMYRHPVVNQMTKNAKNNISTIFDFYFNNPQFLPPDLFINNITGEEIIDLNNISLVKKAEIVSDYIAGMTDRFAINEYKRITDS